MITKKSSRIKAINVIIIIVLCCFATLIVVFVGGTQVSKYYNLTGDKIPTFTHVTGKGIIVSIALGSQGSNRDNSYTYIGVNNECITEYLDFLKHHENFFEQNSDKENVTYLSKKSDDIGKQIYLTVTSYGYKVVVFIEKYDKN